ncbi:MAG: hypothetical protein LBC74_09125 [Planctomycetaceae bacterium]|nr:hypothetical protein [Planctomycetaceae bacterium]
MYYCQLGTDNLFRQHSEHQLAKPYQLPIDQKLPKYLFDSDKLKDKIITIEKSANKKLIEVKLIDKNNKQIEIELSKLSSVDQLYIRPFL